VLIVIGWAPSDFPKRLLRTSPLGIEFCGDFLGILLAVQTILSTG
jgi:hypothetical protein